MTYIYPNGFGGTAVADAFAAAAPIYSSAEVYYVSSDAGNDSNVGTDREKPLATLATALSAVSAGGIVVLMSGHTETIKDLTMAAGVVVVGEGISGGLPTVELTPDATMTQAALRLQAGAHIRNVTFKPYGSACSYPVVKLMEEGCRLTGVRLEMNGFNEGFGVLFSKTSTCSGTTYSHHARLADCTFVSTATAIAALPYYAVNSDSISPQHATFDGCVFDDGTVGFYSGAAAYLRAFLYCNFINCSLLNGADIDASGATGIFNPQTSTGGGKVVL